LAHKRRITEREYDILAQNNAKKKKTDRLFFRDNPTRIPYGVRIARSIDTQRKTAGN